MSRLTVSPCRVMMFLYQLLRKVVCRMFGWVTTGISLDRVRHVLAEWWPITIIGKVGLGLFGFTVLAIRQWLKGGPKTKPEDNPAVTNSSQSEGLGETATVPEPEPEPEPEQKRPCAYEKDDYYCEYDSTWDSGDSQDESEEETQEEDTGYRSRSSLGFTARFKSRKFQAAARDLQNYRHDYPNKRWNCQVSEATDRHPNLDFYLGKQPSLPDNIHIHEFHNFWKGKYDKLESVHSFIQWLFPLQEPGVNPEAYILTKEEIEEFCQNDTARQNLVLSYKLMLDFYGIELCDEATGEVKRASNWEERANNLNWRSHNNLRITRILKCLGTLGFKHYQAPLVRFFLEETLVKGELPNVKDSVLNYFLFAVLDKKERRRLLKFAYLNYDMEEEFVWCPKRMQRKWSASKQHETCKAAIVHPCDVKCKK